MGASNFMNSIKVGNVKSNFFDLSYDVKTSFNMGYLIPSPPIDCVPGDRITLGAKSLVRFAPLVAPVMHRFDIRHEYYFVPKRLLWKNWENWITQTEVAGELPAYPFIDIDGETARPDNFALLNYLGLPFLTGASALERKVSALIPAAYQMVWDQYYRPQYIIDQDPDSFTLLDGDNNANFTALTTLRQRAWERDIMTANLPEAQKGDPVMIPIGSANVIVDPLASGGGRFVGADDHLPLNAGSVDTNAFGDVQAGTPAETAVYDPNNTLKTDDLGATTINDLRLAYALQRLKEKLMRGGSRLTEFLRVVFGVTPQDARLDRAEYITGVKAPVVISEVLNTTGTEELPQGNMSGHGVGVVSDDYNKPYYVQEHGFIICMTSVVPRTAYQQGIDKMWLKYTDPTEEFTPDLAHIGEQATKKREIYAFTADDADDFGYLPRYAEYKTMRSYVTGEFQTSLQQWHDGRIFGSPPELDEFFIMCNPDPRIFAVPSANNHLYAQIYHEVKAVRKMPKFGTPTY